ncbi:MAG TPA: hypothetical protein VF773_16205 [Verrucomicrobiae bacterium]
MGELVNVQPSEIRIMSIEGRRVRVLLKDDRVIEVIYSSMKALDHDLREWAAKTGYNLPESVHHQNSNDIAGYAP